MRNQHEFIRSHQKNLSSLSSLVMRLGSQEKAMHIESLNFDICLPVVLVDKMKTYMKAR